MTSKHISSEAGERLHSISMWDHVEHLIDHVKDELWKETLKKTESFLSPLKRLTGLCHNQQGFISANIMFPRKSCGKRKWPALPFCSWLVGRETVRGNKKSLEVGVTQPQTQTAVLTTYKPCRQTIDVYDACGSHKLKIIIQICF